MFYYLSFVAFFHKSPFSLNMSAKKRTSKKQLSLYLKHLGEYPVLLSGKMHPSNPEEIRNIWDNLTLNLNSCGDGPVRNTIEWKKVFTEWKSFTRKKAREGRLLNDLEKQLIQLTGSAAVSGITEVPELGQDTVLTVENMECASGNEYDWEDIQQDDKENGKVEENIIIEVSEGEAKTSKKKRIRKTTGDLLTDAYAKASSDQKSGLEQIAGAIEEVAKAINRYCNIIEETNEK